MALISDSSVSFGRWQHNTVRRHFQHLLSHSSFVHRRQEWQTFLRPLSTELKLQCCILASGLH